MQSNRSFTLNYFFAGLIFSLSNFAHASVIQSECSFEEFERKIEQRLSGRSKDQLMRDVVHISNRLGYGVAEDGSVQTLLNSWSNLSVNEVKRSISSLLCRSVLSDPVDRKKVESALAKHYPLFAGKSIKEMLELRNLVRQGKTPFKTELNLGYDYAEYVIRVQEFLLASILFEAKNTKFIPFFTKISLFWMNHFSVDTGKIGMANVLSDYYHLFRWPKSSKETKRRFAELLREASEHPLMLSYLDNRYNYPPNFNLNFAREFLELHTLGARPSSGLYTQEDVVSVAKVMSGLALKSVKKDHTVIFVQKRHAQEEKKILGKKIPRGEAGRLALYKLLSNHEATKINICRKLSHFFLDRNPTQEILNRCKSHWGEDGDLSKLYQFFLTSSEFWNPDTQLIGAKSPIELTIAYYLRNKTKQIYSYVRVANQYLKRMNQVPGFFGSPTGYSILSSDWSSVNYAVKWNQFRAISKPFIAKGQNIFTNQMKWTDEQREIDIAQYLTVESPFFLVE